MKFDSEQQKADILNLIAQVPVQTTLGGLFQGPDAKVRELVQAIQNAEVQKVETPTED